MKIDWKDISLKDLAGYISEELRKDGIDLILVGGACVTIYSKNRYQSYDLDFITYEDLRKIKKALNKHGFEYISKHFIRPGCPWIIEFVSPPIAIGNEPIHHFSNVKTKMGTIKMLQPIDCVKDRLASFYHWNDRQGLEQALDVCHEIQDIDFEELKQWSKGEGFLEKYQDFLNHFHQTN
jgi:hypothetical protein